MTRPLVLPGALAALLFALATARAQTIEEALANRMERAKSFYEKKEYDQAVRELDAAIGLVPEHVEAFVLRGRAKHGKGEYDAAIEDYGRAIALDPEQADARYRRALLLQWKQQHEAAVEDLTVVCRSYPDWAPGFLHRGLSLQQLIRYGEAARDYARAAEIDPANHEAWLNASRVYVDMGNLAGAEEICSALIEIAPEHADAWQERGRVRAYLGDAKGSEEDYARAIELEPKEKEHLLSRAQQRMVRGDRDDALADCDRAVDLDPKHFRAYFIRGLVHYNFGDFRKARRDLLKSVTRSGHEPDYTQLYLFLVKSRIPQFRDRARRELDEYLASKKEEPDPWYAVVTDFLCGRKDEEALLAATAAETPRRTRERECEGHFYAGTMRLVAEDPEAAGRHFEACVETSIRNFIEYQSATIELARMEEEPGR